MNGREAELEPGQVMGWTLNNFTLRRGLESILEAIGEISNANGELIGGSDGINQMESRCCYDYREGLVNVNSFHFRSTISVMARKILSDVVSYLFDDWGPNGLEE